MCGWGGWFGGCGGPYWYYGPYGYYGYYGARRPGEERDTAMEILRRRYAKGEITKEQYEQMKKVIIS